MKNYAFGGKTNESFDQRVFKVWEEQMIAALIVLCCFADGPLLGKIVGTPTGNNGYEEYLAAVDLMKSPRLVAAMELRYDLQSAKPDLQREREWVAVCKPVLDLIRRGNAKSVSFPDAKMTLSDITPALSGFKSIAKLYMSQSDVLFADGRAAEAVQTLKEGYLFSHKFACEGSVIESLVSIACFSILTSNFAHHLPDLSMSETASLVQVLDQVMPHPQAIVEGLRRDQKELVDSLAKEPASLKALWGDDGSNAQYAQQFDALSTTEQAVLLRAVSDRLSKKVDAFRALVDQPEHDWVADTAPPSVGNDLADRVVELAWNGDNFLFPFAKCRSQLRLIRLHCAVIDYRWEHNKLPLSLEELPNQLVTNDPLTNGKFYYERLKMGGYALWSLGTGKTGRIELVYRPDKGTIVDSPVGP